MSERYQREIEEILKQAGEPGAGKGAPGPRKSLWRLVIGSVARALGGKKLSFSPARLMLMAVALLLAALIVGAMMPGLVHPLAWAGLLLFIVAYALFFVRPGGANHEKRWRGRVVEVREPLSQRLRRWLRR